jgi:hypothetical protein
MARVSDNKDGAHTPPLEKAQQTNGEEQSSNSPSSSAKGKISGEDTGSSDRLDDVAEEKVSYGWRFWAIFPALCLTGCLSSMEGTVITTALPTISADLGLNANFVWVANGFFLAG